MEVITVSQQKFVEMDRKNSCKLISNKNLIKDTVEVEGLNYCITGPAGNGFDHRIGYLIVPLTNYKGSIEPLTYNAHVAEVRAGRRKRNYNGLFLKYKGTFVVLTGEPVCFKMHSKKLDQLSLF